MTTMTRFVPFGSPLEGVAVFRIGSTQSSTISPTRTANCRMKALVQVTLSLQSTFMRIRPADTEAGSTWNTAGGSSDQPREPDPNSQRRTQVREGRKRRELPSDRAPLWQLCSRTSLPATIETDSAQANYENGVLSITLQKKEAAKPKQLKIEISSGSNSKPTPKQVEASHAA